MTLSQELLQEINLTNEIEPNVSMFIDSSANIFWVSKGGHYVHMSQDSSYNDYIDETHIEVEQKSPESVSNTGVYWNNQDFNSPFHITDFQERIATINV